MGLINKMRFNIKQTMIGNKPMVTGKRRFGALSVDVCWTPDTSKERIKEITYLADRNLLARLGSFDFILNALEKHYTK